MAEFSGNIWAPWRMAYIRGMTPGAQPDTETPGCFLCRYAAQPDRDAANLVLWRSPRTLVLLNRYPYTNGHVMIAPVDHQPDMGALPEAVLFELAQRIRDALRVLCEAVKAEGFNVGLNLGRCAGAGLPDHVHWHVVPRWAGDTNFMSSVGDVRVIPEALQDVYERFRTVASGLSLPKP